MVSSVAPKEEPRCPPCEETTSKILSRISRARVGNWSGRSWRRSAGSLIWSSSPMLMIPFDDVIGQLLQDLGPLSKGRERLLGFFHQELSLFFRLFQAIKCRKGQF